MYRKKSILLKYLICILFLSLFLSLVSGSAFLAATQKGEQQRVFLSAPKGLTAILTNNNGISLSWKKVSDAAQYNIYWKQRGQSDYKMLGKSKKNSINIKPSSLEAGSVYSFKVCAISKAGDSSKKSQAVKIRTLGQLTQDQIQKIRQSADGNTMAMSGSVTLTSDQEPLQKAFLWPLMSV